jgi:hypothetical protein
MRFYCHVHKLSFSASPLAPVQCEKGGHLLGSAPADKSGYDIWEYCCDCQNFWLVSPDGPGSSQCPVCEREIGARYCCDSCKTFSLESVAPEKGRSIYFSLQGIPRPYCPGCKNSEHRKPTEHFCEAYKYAFATLRSECLFCKEHIETIPMFPTSVTSFLSQINSELLEVDFDSESTRFVSSSPGRFVLVEGGKFLTSTILLPNIARFDSAESYQPYEQSYICEQPVAGEIVIDYPATVSRELGSWLLKTAGRLRVEPEKPKDAVTSEPAPLVCSSCSAPIKASFIFCKRCGTRVKSQAVNN